MGSDCISSWSLLIFWLCYHINSHNIVLIWDLIISVPDHFLSFYFVTIQIIMVLFWYGNWLYQFLIIAYLFTLLPYKYSWYCSDMGFDCFSFWSLLIFLLCYHTISYDIFLLQPMYLTLLLGLNLRLQSFNLLRTIFNLSKNSCSVFENMIRSSICVDRVKLKLKEDNNNKKKKKKKTKKKKNKQTLLSSLIARQLVGRQTQWWARHKAIYFSWLDWSCFCLLLGPRGFNCWFYFAPVFKWCC